MKTTHTPLIHEKHITSPRPLNRIGIFNVRRSTNHETSVKHIHLDLNDMDAKDRSQSKLDLQIYN